MIDYNKYIKIPENVTFEEYQKLVECIGKDCPLCKAAYKIRPKLIAQDLNTKKKYILSTSLSEKILKIVEKQKENKNIINLKGKTFKVKKSK